MTVAEQTAGRLGRTTRAGASRYLLLTGAKLNAGDFLIKRRSMELLRALRPDAELRPYDRWKPLDAASVEWADTVVLCGGPALQPRIYPDIYPLRPALADVAPSIVGFGLGWKGAPGDEWTERTYRFSQGGRRLLARLVEDGQPVSCRDPATERVLHASGVHRTVMTGDPAWFDLDHVDRPFEAPRAVDALLVSMPAAPMFFGQSLRLLRALRDLPAVHSLVAVFNHGWTSGAHLDARRAAAYQRLRSSVADLGVEPVDASGGVERMLELASACDLHVGYRLHTHLLFLSRRKPSLLIEEDGRGSAAGQALELPGVRAWERPRRVRILLPGLRAAGPLGRPLQRRVQARIRASENVVGSVLADLERYRDEGFSAFSAVGRRMTDVYREKMRPFIVSLP